MVPPLPQLNLFSPVSSAHENDHDNSGHHKKASCNIGEDHHEGSPVEALLLDLDDQIAGPIADEGGIDNKFFINAAILDIIEFEGNLEEDSMVRNRIVAMRNASWRSCSLVDIDPYFVLRQEAEIGAI